MSIKEITDKILSDAQSVEQDILRDGISKSKEILEKKEEEIKALINNNNKKAKEEGILKRERLYQNTQIKVRDNKLEAKQIVIEKVFNESLERLENLNENEFVEFFKNTLSKFDLSETCEVVLNEKRHSLITSELAKKISKNIIISDSKELIEDGFILKMNKVYYNFTFRAILESLKPELRVDISKLLFKK